MSDARLEPILNIRKLVSLLNEAGFSPDEASGTRVNVKIEGWNYIIVADPGDDYFFQLLLPLENTGDLRKTLHVCNEINRTVKVAKVYYEDTTLYCAAEVFAESPRLFVHDIYRYSETLRAAARGFYSRTVQAD